MSDILITWSKEILSVALLLPLLYFFIKQNKEHSDRLLNQMEVLTKTLADHRQDDSQHLAKIYTILNVVLEKTKKTQLTEEQAIQLLKDRMLIVSIEDKIPFIKSVMEFNHIEWRMDQITDKVYAWLAWYSDKYIANFRTFDSPLWNLADWLNTNFTNEQFNKLVKEIVDIIYREDKWNKSEVIEMKCNEVLTIMKVLQSWLVNKFRNDLIINRK